MRTRSRLQDDDIVCIAHAASKSFATGSRHAYGTPLVTRLEVVVEGLSHRRIVPLKRASLVVPAVDDKYAIVPKRSMVALTR
jgi:hypothetical protein